MKCCESFILKTKQLYMYQWLLTSHDLLPTLPGNTGQCLETFSETTEGCTGVLYWVQARAADNILQHTTDLTTKNFPVQMSIVPSLRNADTHESKCIWSQIKLILQTCFSFFPLMWIIVYHIIESMQYLTDYWLRVFLGLSYGLK